MARRIETALMFTGQAEEAMRFYVSLFGDSTIGRLEKYGPNEMGAEGTIKKASFTIAGHEMACMDSPVKHAFTFTPSTSMFVQCEDESEIDRAFASLSEGGTILMPLMNHGFSSKFAWVNDRFGVSWQLNLG